MVHSASPFAVGSGPRAEPSGFSPLSLQSLSLASLEVLVDHYSRGTLPRSLEVLQGFAPGRILRLTGLWGRVLKDRLWFFGSANLTENDITGWKVDPQYHAGTKGNNYMFKLSSQILKNHKPVGDLSYRYYDQPGVPTPWVTREAARGYHEGIPSWNVMYTWIIDKNSFFELKSAGYSYRRTGFSYQGEDGLVNPVHYDYYTGVSSGGVLYPYWVDYSRFQANASVSNFAEDFLGGDHDFKAGVQYNRGKDVWAGGYSGGKYYMDYAGEPYYLYAWDSMKYGGEKNTISRSFSPATISLKLWVN